MNAYKITWVAATYGESVVEAESKAEARQLALQGKDHDFETVDSHPDWEIESVQQLEE